MTTPTPSPYNDDDRDDAESSFLSSKLNVTAIVIVALALVGVIVVSVATFFRDDAPSQTPGEAAPSTSAPAPNQVGGAGFGTPTTDRFGRRLEVPNDLLGQVLAQAAPSRPYQQGAPISAPQGVKWEYFYGAALPYSTSDGPTAITNGVPTGFARTPQGAALAGYQIMLRFSAGPLDTRKAVTAAMSAGTPEEVTAWVKQQENVTGITSDMLNQNLSHPDGFQVTTYAPDFAAVRYASPLPVASGQPAAWIAMEAIRLVWQDGQWKITQSQPNGSGQQQISALEGWTTW